MIELPSRGCATTRSCPSRAYDGDAGLDLAACERVELGPGERGVVGTGFAVAIPEGYAGSCCRARASPRGTESRSSTHPGSIDSGYRGELKVILLNTDQREPFVVEPGMRMAQLVLVEAAPSSSVEVDELTETERGAAARLVAGTVMARSPGSVSRRCCAGSDRILLCRHDKRGRESGFCPAAASIRARR